MPVVWDESRYQRYYSGAPEGSLAYTCARFETQAMALITQYGLTAMDGLVIVGDAWGGLGTIFGALGFTVELTDSSQYIQDNWDIHGSPHVTKPASTDSYLAIDRMQVRAEERNTAITDWWCIVADCAGDDADVSRFAGFSDPTTGYTSGRGKVVHLITPEYLEGNQEPDNVWQTIEDWQAAFAPLGQEVMSAHLSEPAEVRTDARSGEEESKEGSAAQSSHEGPFDFPYFLRYAFAGPHSIAGRDFIAASDAAQTNPIMTYWNGSEYQQIGSNEPGVPGYSESAFHLPMGEEIAVSFYGVDGDKTTIYVSVYQTASDTWRGPYQVTSTDYTDVQWTALARRSTGEMLCLCALDPERIMGTGYGRLALFASDDDGATWALLMILSEDQQLSDQYGTLLLGAGDVVHVMNPENVSVQQVIRTLDAADSLGAPFGIGPRAYGSVMAWPVLRNGIANMIYKDQSYVIHDITFTSSDDPADYAITQIAPVTIAGANYGAGVEPDFVYCLYSDSFTSSRIANDQGTGIWVSEPLINESGLYTCDERDVNIGYVANNSADPANRYYYEYPLGAAPPEQPDPNNLTFQEWADWNVAVDQEYQEWYGQQNAGDPTTYPERRYYYDWRNEWRNYHAGKGAADPNPPMNQTPPDPYVDPATKEEWCSYNIGYFPAAVAWYESMTAGDPVEYPEVRVWNDWVNEFNGYMDRNDMRPRVH